MISFRPSLLNFATALILFVLLSLSLRDIVSTRNEVVEQTRADDGAAKLAAAFELLGRQTMQIESLNVRG
jgi:hypothetical protein